MVTIISDELPRIVVGVDSHKRPTRPRCWTSPARFSATRASPPPRPATASSRRGSPHWAPSSASASSAPVPMRPVSRGSSGAPGRRLRGQHDASRHSARRARTTPSTPRWPRARCSRRSERPAKDTTGDIESIRLLKLSRESAIKARTIALLQIRDVLITAPAELREWIESAGGARHRVNRAWALRPDLERLGEPLQAAKFTLRQLSRRVKFLDEEIAGVDRQLAHSLSDVLRTCCSAAASALNTPRSCDHGGTKSGATPQ